MRVAQIMMRVVQIMMRVAQIMMQDTGTFFMYLVIAAAQDELIAEENVYIRACTFLCLSFFFFFLSSS